MQNQFNAAGSKRIWKRIAAALSAVVLSAGMLPETAMTVLAEEFAASAAAEDSRIHFSKEMIDALQEACGDDYDAETVLMTLYEQGLIDNYGEVIPKEYYNINGVMMTEAQLRTEAMQHAIDEEVVAEGDAMTWGDLQSLLLYKEYALVVQEFARALKNGELDMSDPTRANLRNELAEQLKNGFSIENGEFKLNRSGTTELPYVKGANESKLWVDSENSLYRNLYGLSDWSKGVYSQFMTHAGTISIAENDTMDISVDGSGNVSTSLGGKTISYSSPYIFADGEVVSWEFKMIDPYDELPKSESGLCDDAYTGPYILGEDGQKYNKGTFVGTGSKMVFTVHPPVVEWAHNGVHDEEYYLPKFELMICTDSKKYVAIPFVVTPVDADSVRPMYVDAMDRAIFMDGEGGLPEKSSTTTQDCSSSIASVEVLGGSYMGGSMIPVKVTMQQGHSIRTYNDLVNSDDPFRNEVFFRNYYSLKYFDGDVWRYASPYRAGSCNKEDAIENNYGIADVVEYDKDGNEYIIFGVSRLAEAVIAPSIVIRSYYYTEGQSASYEYCSYEFTMGPQVKGVGEKVHPFNKECDEYAYRNLIAECSIVPLLGDITGEKGYNKGDGREHDYMNQSPIFDWDNITWEYVADESKGISAGSKLLQRGKLPLRTYAGSTYVKNEDGTISFYDQVTGLTNHCTHGMEASDFEAGSPWYSPYTEISQQWVSDQTNGFQSDHLLGTYWHDANNLYDTKVYYHVVNLENGGNYVDYLYFYVMNPNDGVPFRCNGRLFCDWQNFGHGMDLSDGSYQLPMLSRFDIVYRWDERTPLYTKYDASTEFGEGSYVYYEPNPVYDEMLEKVEEKNASQWFKDRMYLLVHPAYAQNRDDAYVTKQMDDLAPKFNPSAQTPTLDDYFMQVYYGLATPNGRPWNAAGSPINYDGYSASADPTTIFYPNELLKVSLVPQSPTLQYSDKWLSAIDSYGGSTNGVPLCYTRPSTNSALKAHRQELGSLAWNSPWEFYDLHKDGETAFDIPDSPFYDSGKSVYSIDAMTFNKESTAAGESTITLTVQIPETKYTDTVTDGYNNVDYEYTRGTGYLFGGAFRWTAEFTSLDGETVEILPNEKGGAVEFTTEDVLDPTTNEFVGSRMKVQNFSANDEGTIVFKLRIFNSTKAIMANTAEKIEALEEGTDYVELESSPLRLLISSVPYLIVPSASKKILAYHGEVSNVLFSSNVARRNKALFGTDETEFTVKIYECDADGEITNETPVYEGSEKASYSQSITSLSIPKGILNTVSSENGVSYKAVISTSLDEEVDGVQHFSDTALICVEERPLSIVLDTETGCFVNDNDVVLSYNVVGGNSAFNGYYNVVRKSDNLEIVSDTNIPAEAGSGISMSLTIPKAELVLSDDDSLKEMFAVTFYARNSADGEYSIGANLIAVYNDGSLSIDVAGSECKNGSEITIDKHDYLEANPDSKYENVIDRKLSLATIQKNIRMKEKVNIHYGNAIWGIVSDVINWKFKDESDSSVAPAESALLYTSYGELTPVEEEGKILIPSSELTLFGAGDAEGEIEATHVNTGMSSKVKVKFKDVENELYLIQFSPAKKTVVDFVKGNGQKCTVESNDNGMLALYEPEGIKAGSTINARYTDGTVDYRKTFNPSELKTGTQSFNNGGLYPINSVKLRRSYSVSITIPEAKEKDITLRGGVFKDPEYDEYGNMIIDYDKFTEADLLTSLEDKATKDGKANGIEGVTFRTDSTGSFIVYFDSTQIVTDKNEEESEAKLCYAFEVEADGYYKKSFEINNRTCSDTCTMLYGLVNLDKKTSDAPNFKMLSQKEWFSSSGLAEEIKDDTEYISFTKRSDEIRLSIQMLLAGYEDGIIEKKDGIAYLIEDTEKVVRFINGKTEKELGDGKTSIQKNQFVIYPFSTIVSSRTSISLKKEEVGNWLTKDYYVQTSLGLYDGDSRLVKADLKYNILNTDLENSPTDPDEIKALDKSVKKSVKKAMETNPLSIVKTDGVVGKIVGGGFTALLSGMTDSKNVMNMSLGVNVLPTSDPTRFEVLIGVGAEDSMMRDEYVDELASGEAKAQFLNNEASTEDDDDDDEPEPSMGAFFLEGLGLDGSDMNKTAYKEMEEKKDTLKKKYEARKNGTTAGGDDDDGDNKPDVSVGGVLYGIMEARYDVEKDEWSYSFIGLTVGVEAKVDQTVWEGQALVGPVPVNYSLHVIMNLSFKLNFKSVLKKVTHTFDANGTAKYTLDEERDFMVLPMIHTRIGAEFFIGVGIDWGLIALTVGAFAEGGINIDYAALIDKEPHAGVALSGDITVGLKFKARLFLLSYETVICSASAGFEVMSPNYKEIINIWSGNNVDPEAHRPKPYGKSAGESQNLTIVQYADGTMDLQLDTVSQRAPLMKPAFNENDKIFAEANQEKFAALTEVKYSDDGKMIVFLDDNVASYANGDGIAQGAVIADGDSTLSAESKPDELPQDEEPMSDEEKKAADEDPSKAGANEVIANFGDYQIDISGTAENGFFAAWTQQRNSSEANLDDLAIAMNSTEIIAAVYDSENGKWNETKLTNNFQSDVLPTITSIKDKAVVVWQSTYNADLENPLAASVCDKLMFSVYEDGAWSEVQTAYNGSLGNIHNFQSAMLDDGSVLVAFTAETEKDVTDVFYLTIGADGTVSDPVRATVTTSNENNVRVTALNKSDKEKGYLIAWYDVDAADIYMMYVRENGTIDSSFPERLSKEGLEIDITDAFDITGGESFDDFAIVWASAEYQAEGEDQVPYMTVCGAKLYKAADDKYGVSAPQKIATMNTMTKRVNDISLVSDGKNSVKMILSETDYTDVKGKTVTVEAVAETMLSNETFDTDEEYQKAYEEKVKELNLIRKNRGDDFLTLMVAEEKTMLETVSYKFQNAVTLTNAEFDENAVVPGLETTVLLTVTNNGLTPIQSLSVNNETLEIDLSGDEAILPGESIVIPYTYKVPEMVSDAAFEIKTDSGATSTGTVYLDAPQVDIENADVVRSENGIRTLSLHMVNTVAIPLAESEKDLVLNLYPDGNYDNCYKTITISKDDTDVRKNIDNGVGAYEIEIDVKDYMEWLLENEYMKPDDDFTEIAEAGIPLVVTASIANNNGENLSFSSTEVSLKSLLSDRDNPFVITNYLDITDTTVTVHSTIANNSLSTQYLCNVAATLFDEDGNIIATKDTNSVATEYDEIAPESELVLTEKPDKYDVVFDDLTEDEIESIAYVVSEAFDTNIIVTFDMGIADDVKNIVLDEVVLGTVPAMPAQSLLQSEWGTFAGWYTDEALTESYNNTKLVRDTTLYAKWKLPNIDVTGDNVFIAPDGNALTYDADTRTLICSDGSNPTVNAGAMELNLDNVFALNADGTRNEASEAGWFNASWFDLDGKECNPAPQDAGAYTVEITASDKGAENGVEGTLVIHVVIAPYELTVKAGTVTVIERDYDGTNVVKVDTSNAEIVFPNGSEFFHGDKVELVQLDSLNAEASDVIGNVTVTYKPVLTGKNAANYTFGEATTLTTEIKPRTAELEWGTVDADGNFTAGTDSLKADAATGKVTVAAIVANAVEGDKVNVVLRDNTSTAVYKDITTTATKLEGADAANYQLGENAFLTWQAISDKVVMDTASLTLEGNIGLNFYVYLPQKVADDPDAYVNLICASKSDSQKLYIKDLTPDAKGRYKVTYRLAAKETNDEVAVQVQNGSNKIMPMTMTTGTAVANNSFKYSVTTYINAVLNGDYPDAIKQLCATLSDYGSYAQKYFGYRTDARQAIRGDVSEVTSDTLSDFAFTTSGTLPEGLNLAAATLILDSETSIRLYFTVDEDKSISDYSFTVANQAATPIQKGDQYYIELADIPARDLDTVFTFGVNNNAYIVKYCALSYAEMAVSQYGGKARYADLTDLSKALYLYNQAANEYFND